MKVKVTEKQVKNNYDKILIVGYCDLYYLLSGLEPRYYTSGVYGWNSNIYQYNYNIAICTGYRPFGNIRTNDKGLNSKYNNKAREIYENYDEPYDVRLEKINKLLDEYIKEILKSEEV